MSLSREQIQKFGDEIIAFGEGKQIRFYNPNRPAMGWRDCIGDPLFTLALEYEVKPEPEKPKFGYVSWSDTLKFLHADIDRQWFKDNTEGLDIFQFVTRTPEIDELLKKAGYELPEEGGDK